MFTVEKVVFKHEDEVEGRVVGPVWLYGEEIAVGIPRWYTLEEARQLAKQLTVPIEEA